MRSKRVAILVLPTRIELAALQGQRVVAAERIPVSIESHDGAWADAIRQCAPILKPAVERLGVEGAAAIVLYASPTQSVEQISLRSKSAAAARQAALLSGTDSLSYPVTAAACEAAIIGHDPAGAGRHTHLVVVCERDDHLQVLVDLVEEAGLRFESATPIEAAVISIQLGTSLVTRGSEGGRLVIGELSSLFFAMHQGKLRFARRIGLGLDHLITSLTRPIRGAGSAAPIELDRDTAACTLQRCGIPSKERSADWPHGLSPMQFMPLLQPVLQRFVVELRQSLRFSLSDHERQGLTITLAGPGGGIPGLAELLTEELGLTITVDPVSAAYDGSKPVAEGGEFHDAILHQPCLARAHLVPRGLSACRMQLRLRRWMWAGAAAAVLAVGFEGSRTQWRIDEAQKNADSLIVQSSQSEALSSTCTRLTESVGAMNALEKQIAAEVLQRPNLRALLQDLSRLVPEGIRLRTISLERSADAMTGRIEGYRLEGQSLSLDQLVSKFSGSPLLREVTLGNVQATEMDAVPAQDFEMRFTAIPAPVNALGDAGTRRDSAAPGASQP